jgi:hypothetical protein
MRKYVVGDGVIILLGLLLAFGPRFLFRPCGVMEGNIPLCHWSCQAELGMGLVTAFLGIFLICFNEVKTKIGLLIGIFLTNIVALAIPHALIGGCGMMSMRCRRITFPALSITSVVILLFTVGYVFLLDARLRKMTQQPVEQGAGSSE